MVRTISVRIPRRYHHIITPWYFSQGNPFCSFFVSRLSAGHLFLDPIWVKTGWSQHKIMMPLSIPIWSELNFAFYVSTQRTTFLFWTIINVQNRILLPSPKIHYFVPSWSPDLTYTKEHTYHTRDQPLTITSNNECRNRFPRARSVFY